MSQENVEIVRRMYEAFADGDAAAALGFIDPKIVMDATHRVDGHIGHGLEEMVAILAEWFGTWEEWRQDVEEIRDLGDRVLVISTQQGIGVRSGIEWQNRFAMIYELEGGTITRWTIYDDLREALEAVGLSE
ncbi:MAG: nuclear transport factor 2 family protein [Thermoleophilaceae bacterium]|nr:nuclear transport factor 2 family protein [Thermoleophilaceae bacterium]